MIKKRFISMLVLLAAVVTGAWAQTWDSGACTVTLSEGVMTVSGTGPMEDYDDIYFVPWYGYDIKTIVIESGVSSIGNYAFGRFYNLESVSIPASVTSIGTLAFQECGSDAAALTVSFAEGSTPLTIGEQAFTYANLKSIDIPNRVTSIGRSAFASCSNLESVSIPASVTSIGTYAFQSCGSYAEALTVSFAEGSTPLTISEGAFYEAKLTSIDIPNRVTSIGYYAFSNCSNLESVSIPASVTSISDGAFGYCGMLAKVSIYAPSLTTYGAYAFDGNAAGRKIYVLPDAVDTYKAGWSAYAADIEAMTVYETSVKEGTEDAENWSATPSLATEGQTVTITYAGTKSVKSVTAKRKTATTGNITVYFTDALDYGDVHVYYWSDGPDWPGTAMTYVETNDYNQKIYKAVVPATAVGIIFNGNGSQTVDITENIADGSWWYATDQLEDGWKNKVGYVGKYTEYVEVTNVDDNKWTFTQPDCNVELDIEYNVTYPVTISDGDVDAANWSATPTEQSVGQNVTLKYTGKKKVKRITIEAAITDLSTLTADYEAKDGETLTGTLANNVKISIADGATVTLKDVTINGVNNSSYNYAGITCAGDATITLEGTNTVKGFHYKNPGIFVSPGKTLVINGTGELNARSNGWGAGIGGGFDIACGNIVINSGNITATGGGSAAGIGGGSHNGLSGNGSCGDITINGGTITATGGQNAAGIGGGFDPCGNITISGGTITATGGKSGAGIGGGSNRTCGNITISGGTVEATGGDYAAGIGGGRFNPGCGTITITSGVTSVTATKGNDPENIGSYAESIGCGDQGSEITVTIGGVSGAISESPYTYDPSATAPDPTPTATDLSTISADYEAKDGETLTGTLANNVKISIADGATVTLKDVNITNLGDNCDWAGINCPGDATLVLEGTNEVCAGRDGYGENNYPGIYIAPDKTLTIQGDGTLTAYGNGTNPYGAGIGGGFESACGNIVIKGGNITATGGLQAAGIGSGEDGSCGSITISGGTVTATGGAEAAGIGGGYQGICGAIYISGGTITAKGGYGAAGIGGGRENKACGTITITSGVTKVEATKGEDAPCSIGKGLGGTDITVTIGGTEYASGISQSPYEYPLPTLNITNPTVGQVIGSDGKNYAADATLPTGVTAVAMIAYVSGSHGLAIALADESGNMNWETAVSTAAAHTPAFTGGTWKLPTKDEWKQMFSANGGKEDSCSGLNTALAAVGGDSSKLLESGIYWSSTLYDENNAWRVDLFYGNGEWDYGSVGYNRHVRACLAF